MKHLLGAAAFAVALFVSCTKQEVRPVVCEECGTCIIDASQSIEVDSWSYDGLCLYRTEEEFFLDYGTAHLRINEDDWCFLVPASQGLEHVICTLRYCKTCGEWCMDNATVQDSIDIDKWEEI